MEVFSLYVLSFLAVFISFSIAFLRQSYEPKRTKLPPGSFGFPVVGETLHYYLGGPENFIRKRMDKYSEEVFKTSMVGENVAVVCGAAGNKFLLYNANDVVVPWIPATASKFLTWADSPGKSSSTKYALSKVRSFLHSILRPDAMRQYVPIMDSIARQHLKADWEPFQEVKVYPLPQKYTLSLACKLILGLEDVSRAQSLSESFRIAMQGVFSIPINFPGTIHYRALKEIRKVKHGLLEIILERKKLVLENRERVGSDILSRILLDENTRSTTDSEIALYLLSLMLPSYESTSSSITIVLKYLAELPQIYNMVFNEFMEIAKSKAPEDLLNLEDIRKMKYSWNVVCEAFRLTPSGLGTFREAQTDINFAGITIPKGWKILWSNFTTNKNPKYFPDPKTFDPTRFDGDGPVPCSFIPFSAGNRICPGKEYSKFVILIYMYNVVRKFKLQKLIPDEKIRYRGSAAPANGLPVRLQPH